MLLILSRSLKMRRQIFAAIKCAAAFHCEVDGLVNIEHVEEMEQHPKVFFVN